MLNIESIMAAEHLRAQGKNKQAREMLRPLTEVSLRRFEFRDLDQQTRYLMGLRVLGVATLSLAKNSWRADKVADGLEKARSIIWMQYEHPEVQAVSTKLDKDVNGNPYDFDVEMERDKANYLLTLASLTGDTRFVEQAVAKLDAIAEQATEPTAKAAARFTKHRLTQRTDSNPLVYEALKKAYQDVVQRSEVENRWERSSTIASRFAIDALRNKRWGDAYQALQKVRTAASHDPATRTIFIREFAKDITEGFRHRTWRMTASNKDYHSLAI